MENTEATLRIHKLTKDSLDKLILDELGGEAKAETFLATIYELLEKQPNGKKGDLSTNGYANIFYVCDVKGVLWAVSVIWFSYGWYVSALSVQPPFGWGAGVQVFSSHRTEA